MKKLEGEYVLKAACKVDFSQKLRTWDGFGVNYVGAAQTRDYDKWPQDYGSFELLSEKDRQEIINMIFGDDGLRPCIGKMFIDPWMTGQEEPEGINKEPFALNMDMYNPARTTRWMRYFMQEGLKRIKARGGSFEIICTLYGPPAWMTKQKMVRGRDLDDGMEYELAKYMIAFAKYMKEKENLPIRYISLHNEGGAEEVIRWPEDGKDRPELLKCDYDLLWSEEKITRFLGFMGDMLKAFGLPDVGLANGECTILPDTTQYIKAIIKDPEALKNFALMTSHGFEWGDQYFSAEPMDLIREKKPDFKGWITSASWGKMDIKFPMTIHKHIYRCKINGYIPWATIQRKSQWVGGDPNPGTAISIHDDGSWSVERGYYLFKHYCPAAQAGMAVVHTESDNEEVMVSAFSGNGTKNPDALIVINGSDKETSMELKVENSNYRYYTKVVTDDDRTYEKEEDAAITDKGVISLVLPARSIITLRGKQ